MNRILISILTCATYASREITVIADTTTISTVVTTTTSPNPVAIITGGTRGIGKGIASALVENGYDLLLTYNTNEAAANEFASSIMNEDSDSTSTAGGGARGYNNHRKVVCVGGDISLPETRDKIFACLDSDFANQPLQVMVHNAGQYVGITADNSDGLHADDGQYKPLKFGDGSLLTSPDISGSVDFSTMHYYQRMYGEAFVDLCERSLVRMTQGGSLIGISSPGVTAHLYRPGPDYSMPGSGKCLMEYSMRIYAIQAAARNVNVNLIVPGVTRTDAWEKLANRRGMDVNDMLAGIVASAVPMKRELCPRDIGNVVAFLCSDGGRFVTGTVVPVDGGLHLKR